MTSPVAGATPGSTLVAGLDLLSARESAADHVALEIADELVAALRGSGGPGAPDEVVVATHAAVVGTLRHVALSIEVPQEGADVLRAVLSRYASDGAYGALAGTGFAGQPELRAPLESVVAAHTSRSEGRVVRFRGSDRLRGTVTVGEVVEASAIDRVEVLAGGSTDPSAQLVTRDFLRPRWVGGDLVLHVQPAIGGTLVPFETPNPTPCCAEH